MGVSTDGVVVHLAWVACWVVEKLLGLVTAVARVDSAWGLGARDLEEVTEDGSGELVTTIDEEGDITRLDTAIDVLVVVVVVLRWWHQSCLE